MLGAVMFGHQQFQPVLQAIIEFAEAAAKDPWDLPPPAPEAEEIERKVRQAVSADLAAAYRERQKKLRTERIGPAKAKLAAPLPEAVHRQPAATVLTDVGK